MKEDASDRTARYVRLTTASLKRLKLRRLPISVKESQVRYVLNAVQAYVEDAEHYAEKRKPVTSLACVAYAEGLLDAIKFLEIGKF